MEIKLKNISLNSPNVKITADIKVIDRPAPEFKTLSAAAVTLIPAMALLGTLENFIEIQEGA